MLIARDYTRIARQTFTGWWIIKAPRLGAALVYYTILSLAPLIVIATPIISLAFSDPAQVQGGIVSQFEGLVGKEGAAAVKSILSARPNFPPTRLTTYLGIAVLVFGATGVFAELQDALNTVWGVVPAPGGFGKHAIFTFLRQRFVSFAMVLGICFLLMVSLILSAGLAVAQQLVDRRFQTLALTWTIAHDVIGVVIVTLLFAMMFKILPDAKVPWRDVWVGALGTSLLFTLGKYLIGLYLGHSSTASAYGAAGSLILIVLWVYYSSLILLLGAEFTAVRHEATVGAAEPKPGAVRVHVEEVEQPRRAA